MHFMVAALGKDCDEFTLHIYASLAEQERRLISERNKAAAAVMKRAGKKLWSSAVVKSEAAKNCGACECRKAQGRAGSGISDTGISGFLSGPNRREVHAKAKT